MVSDEQVLLVTWYVGITSLCSIKGSFNSYFPRRLQQIQRFPSLSSSHTFSKIHMHTYIHVYVHVFTLPHTVVLKDQNLCFLSQRNRYWQHNSGEDDNVLQTAESRWASFCTADHGWHGWMSITVSQKKILQKCRFLLIPIKWSYVCLLKSLVCHRSLFLLPVRHPLLWMWIMSENMMLGLHKLSKELQTILFLIYTKLFTCGSLSPNTVLWTF